MARRKKTETPDEVQAEDIFDAHLEDILTEAPTPEGDPNNQPEPVAAAPPEEPKPEEPHQPAEPPQEPSASPGAGEDDPFAGLLDDELTALRNLPDADPVALAQELHKREADYKSREVSRIDEIRQLRQRISAAATSAPAPGVPPVIPEQPGAGVTPPGGAGLDGLSFEYDEQSGKFVPDAQGRAALQQAIASTVTQATAPDPVVEAGNRFAAAEKSYAEANGATGTNATARAREAMKLTLGLLDAGGYSIDQVAQTADPAGFLEAAGVRQTLNAHFPELREGDGFEFFVDGMTSFIPSKLNRMFQTFGGQVPTGASAAEPSAVRIPEGVPSPASRGRGAGPPARGGDVAELADMANETEIDRMIDPRERDRMTALMRKVQGG